MYDYKRLPNKNTIFSFTDTIPEKEIPSVPANTPADISVLTKGLGKTFEYMEPVLTSFNEALPGHVGHPIEGFWVAAMREDNDRNINPVVYLNIGPVTGKDLSLNGIESINTVSISGTLESAEPTEEAKSIDITMVFDIYHDLRLKGTYDSERDAITGLWVIVNDEGEFPTGPDDDECTYRTGSFVMTRTPPHAFRFRHLLDTNVKDKDTESLNLARRRWVFAIEAVRFKARENAGSWKFIRERIKERRFWIECSIRDILPSHLKVTRGFLTPEATTEWNRVKRQLHPATLHFYEAIAVYLNSRKVHSM